MKSLRLVALVAGVAAAGAGLPSAQALGLVDPPIKINLYSNFAETVGSGIAFSNLFGQQASFDINFLPTGEWWPLGDRASFGALLTSGLMAPAAGNYTLTLGSDDASYLFIDGALVQSLPNSHSYITAQPTITLTAGYHDMTLQFYNSLCCNSKLTLDPGSLAFVSAVPEPASAPLWLGGLLATGWAARRWRGHSAGGA